MKDDDTKTLESLYDAMIGAPSEKTICYHGER